MNCKNCEHYKYHKKFIKAARTYRKEHPGLSAKYKLEHPGYFSSAARAARKLKKQCSIN